jgi:DNA-binding GntR family transcriptional regulator
MLQGEGLVIAEPNYPVRVAFLTADDLEQIYVRLIALESVAIRITVPKLTSDDLADLEASMARMDHYVEVGDTQGFRGPHRAFHHRLIAGAGLGVSADIDILADHAERYRMAVDSEIDWDARRTEHRAILDAAKKGDADLAALRLAEHYAITARLAFGEIEPERDLDGLRIALRTVGPSVAELLDRP